MKDRIRLVRKDAGYNQEAFATELGLSRSMVVKVENGDAVFSDRAIRDICRLCNVNEEWLRTGVGDMYVPISRREHIAEFINEAMEADDDRLAWIDVLSRLSVEEWELLSKMAREFANKKED